jgi:hypothetical protein
VHPNGISKSPFIPVVIAEPPPSIINDIVAVFNASNAVWVAELTGLFASEVLSTFPNPT